MSRTDDRPPQTLTTDDLLLLIGRLYAENAALRVALAAASRPPQDTPQTPAVRESDGKGERGG